MPAVGFPFSLLPESAALEASFRDQDWSRAGFLLKEQNDKLLEFINSLLGPYDEYTPVWTRGVGTPAIGNGYVNGYYKLLGTMVDLDIVLVGGTTTTSGTSGAFSLSLPYPAAPKPGSSNSRRVVGPAYFFDSGVLHRRGICYVDENQSVLQALFEESAGSTWGASNPTSLTNGDLATFHLRYEAKIPNV